MFTIKYYNVGTIVNTQGIKGEVRVIATTDFPQQRFKIGSYVYAFLPSGTQEKLTIDGARRHKSFILLHFVDHPSINDVEGLKKATLKIDEQQHQSTTLKPGEYLYQQIIGLQVYDLDHHLIGEITDIMSTGANDVWVVQRSDNGQELLLPKIPDVVKKVDLDHQQVTIDLLEGLE